MSENYTRKEVRSVSSSVLPIATGGIVLAAGLVSAVLSSLSSSAREAYRLNSGAIPTNRLDSIKPVTALRDGQRTVNSCQFQLSQTEAVKVSTLLTLSNSEYLVENAAAAIQKMRTLIVADTLPAVQTAQKSLMHDLENGHQQIFVKSLALACANASLKAGFASIKTQTTAASSARIIGTDPSGRALVTEITAASTQEPKIVTEVVGISDGSCKEFMNAFDRALEEQGVKSSQPVRKFTGGVCETATAWDFVKKRVCQGQSKRSQSSTHASFSGTSRTQKLNQRNTIKQKK